MIRYILCLIFLSLCNMLYSQSNDYVIIEEIVYIGNVHTRDHVIDRELDISVGDSIKINELTSVMDYNTKRLLATALFTEVNYNIRHWDAVTNQIQLEISFNENWYIYPSIIFEVADRNFNVWLFDQDRKLDRLNYGVGLEHINLTGNKDRLKLKFQRGYTHKYELIYDYPYLKNNLGASVDIFYADYNEIGYSTIGNKTIFAKNKAEDKLLKRLRLGGGISYRSSARMFHDLHVQYHHNRIDPFVVDSLSYNYFNGDSDFKMLSAAYTFTYDDRLFNFYPIGGWYSSVRISKEGLGLYDDYDNLTITAELQKYVQHSDRWSTGIRLVGSTKTQIEGIDFANNTGLGYEDDLIRGYELYVMDGPQWILGKLSSRYKIYEKTASLGKYMLIPRLRKLPIEIFLRTHFEMGYVKEKRFTETNILNNSWRYGYGPGVDLIFYHAFLFSVEYNFNDLGEHNFYLKSTFNF